MITVKSQVRKHRTILGVRGGDIRTQEHTRECREKYLMSLGVQQDWLNRWPNYCDECDGWGGYYFPGTHNSPPESEPCFCTEVEECPRCGHVHNEGWSSNPRPCEKCGWCWGKPDDVKPQLTECYCWEERNA